MFIILVAIISLIIGLIRGGSIKNLFNGGIKCWWLFLVPIILFLALQAGQLLEISLITNNAFLIMVIAYILLFVCIFFNLDNIWMYLLLAGGLLNFVVIFINQAKMPLNPSALSIAHLGEGYLTKFAATVVAASSSTKLAFLGGIIPIPLVSIFRQVISPGTLVMAISTFAILQNALIYTYIDEAQYEKYLSEENSDSSSEDPVPTMPILEGIQQARQTNSLEDIREQLGEFGYGPVEEDEVTPIDENIEEEDIPIDVFEEEDEVEEVIPTSEEVGFEQENQDVCDDDFIANFEDDVDGDILDAFVEGDIEKIDQELSDLGINQDDEQSLPYEDEEEFSFEEDDSKEQEVTDIEVENEEDNLEEDNIFEDSDAILQEEMDSIEDTLNTIEDEFEEPVSEQADDDIQIQDDDIENIIDEEEPQEELEVIDEQAQDFEMEIEDEVDDLYNSVFDDNMSDIEDVDSVDQDISASDDIFEMPDISALNMINDTPIPPVNEPVNAVPIGAVVPGVINAGQSPSEEEIEEEMDNQMTRTFTPIRERNQSFEDVLGDDEPIETTPTEVLEQMEDESAKDSENIEFTEYQEEPLTEDLDEIVRKVQQEEVASAPKTIITREDIISDSPEKITVERPTVKDNKAQENELKEEEINNEADKAFNSHIKHQEEMNNKVNVDSPFMIIDGNIVENPNYKFRKGPKEEEKSKEDLQDSSVYVMNSGSLSELDKDNDLTGSSEPVFEVTPKEEKIIEEITREVKEEIKNTSSLPTNEELEEIMNEDKTADIDVSAVSEVMDDNEDDIVIDKGKYDTANINELRELAKDYDPSISAVSEIETEDTEQVSVIEPEPIEEENPYEKVEMKIGDVEIKFWKKDNDKQSR